MAGLLGFRAMTFTGLTFTHGSLVAVVYGAAGLEGFGALPRSRLALRCRRRFGREVARAVETEGRRGGGRTFRGAALVAGFRGLPGGAGSFAEATPDTGVVDVLQGVGIARHEPVGGGEEDIRSGRIRA